MKDLQKIQYAIELFLVRHFQTNMLAGCVKQQKSDSTIYYEVDLYEHDWDEDVEELHDKLSVYLIEWARQNYKGFSDPIEVSRILIGYKLTEKDYPHQIEIKAVKLFVFPPEYYELDNYNSESKPSNEVWDRISWDYSLLLSIPILIFLGLSIEKIQTDEAFQNRLVDSFGYINIANGIIASFVLGFIINKVANLRENKLKHTNSIRQLSNQLTYFRNVCFNLARDHVFWNSKQLLKRSYDYANSIKHDISYLEYRFPEFEDPVKTAKFKAYFNDEYSNSVVSLILQLNFLADRSFLNTGLSFTVTPPDHIYSQDEMEHFMLFNQDNQIWYCCSRVNVFPEDFNLSHHSKEIVADLNRIYPGKKMQQLTRQELEDISVDFQYRIIPNLFHLTRLVEKKLPLSITYFVTTFILLLVFGLILPTIMHVFISGAYSSLSIFLVIGIISHILLSIKPILKQENHLNRLDDYL